jgi:hypothetical protein
VLAEAVVVAPRVPTRRNSVTTSSPVWAIQRPVAANVMAGLFPVSGVLADFVESFGHRVSDLEARREYAAGGVYRTPLVP